MTMSKAKVQQMKGKLKEAFGKATGDRSMQREGRGDVLRGKAHAVADKAADRFRRRPGH
ncbi:CsbD family protein [Streptomyces sp. NPDC020681]|uniref:CsbD family protein n=1 Tax=Streptomyces sp. NPDC020681 TaxID=3365083 RepID=UPI0037A0D5DA